MSILSETLCSYVNFFKIFIKNPLLSCPYLIKNVNSIKTTLYYEPKSQYDAFFFRFLTEKSSLSCPYFVKNDHSPKSTLLSSLDFVIKTALFSDLSLKNNNFHAHILSEKHPLSKNTLLSCQYLVRKTSIH